MRRGACNGRTWRRLGGVGAIWTMPGPPRPSAPPQIPVSTATDEPRPRSAGSEPPPRLELCQAARARLLDRDAGTGRRTRRPKRGRLHLDVALIPLTVPEVRRLLVALAWALPPPEEHIMRWSCWRRRHQARARRCHYKRRLERLRQRNQQVRL